MFHSCVRNGALVVAILAVAGGLNVASSTKLQASDRTQPVIGVDQMPPVMRAAYLRGIRVELLAHEYDAGRIDNASGDKFLAAIRAYQQDAGLPTDGVPSKELLDHLMFALPKVYAKQPHASVDREAIVPPKPKEAPKPGIVSRDGLMPGLEDLARKPVHSKRLPPLPNSEQPSPMVKRGGGVVTRLQETLLQRGYYKGPIDGAYGDELADAVRQYQKDNDLPATGVIDVPLLNAIFPQALRHEQPQATKQSETDAG